MWQAKQDKTKITKGFQALETSEGGYEFEDLHQTGSVSTMTRK